MLSGEKVTGNVGGDLNIESKQDSNSYKEKNTSAGLNLDLNLNNGKIGSAAAQLNPITTVSPTKAAFMQAKAASISPSIKIPT